MISSMTVQKFLQIVNRFFQKIAVKAVKNRLSKLTEGLEQFSKHHR